MKIVYAEQCDCADPLRWVEGFEPVFFPSLDDERLGAHKHLEAELRLQRGDGKLRFAVHVAGRHILMVYLGRSP